jgi:hypothetical protein
MRLHLEYALVLQRPEVLSLPLSVTAEGKSFTAQAPVPPLPGLRVVVEARVDPSTLSVEPSTGVFRASDGSEIPLLRVPEKDDLVEFAQDVTNALAFLTDQHITLMNPLGSNVLVPETPKDEARLAELGTAEVWRATSLVGVGIATVWEPSSRVVGALLRNRAGLMIYAEALALPRPAPRFRELWRVLESAFARKDDKLVKRLAVYGPAVEMGFTRAELKRLLVLRGRASHAASKPKAGRREIARVNHDAERSLPRLRSLIERVLLTKRSWGYPTGEVDVILPLDSHVSADGDMHVQQAPGRARSGWKIGGRLRG